MTTIQTETEYRGFTIEPCVRGYDCNSGSFMFYPTEEGVQHDADCDGDGYHYCGNCQWADSISEAKAQIDCEIFEKTVYIVDTVHYLGKYRMVNITKFLWLNEAIAYALRFNGTLRNQFDSI